jgi:RNA polymerase sigma-70 factor, ECF subfamily
MAQSLDQVEVARQPSDEELVAAAQLALPAFEHLYRRHVPDVYRFCFRRLGSESDAADATSVIFTHALANIKSCRPTSFRSWLYAIARNVVIDHYRASRPADSIDAAYAIPDEALGPEALTIQNDQRRSVERALTRLTDGERSVIELRLAGLTTNEIATALGKTRNAIDQVQFRALAHLRELLAPASAPTGEP